MERVPEVGEPQRCRPGSSDFGLTSLPPAFTWRCVPKNSPEDPPPPGFPVLPGQTVEEEYTFVPRV